MTRARTSTRSGTNRSNMTFLPRLFFLWCCISREIASQAPSNNDCSTALPLTVAVEDDSSTTSVTGTTTMATNDQLRFCGSALVNSPGVWYRYERMMQREAKVVVVRVSTCHEDTTFDTALSLFRATKTADNTECSNLQCVLLF